MATYDIDCADCGAAAQVHRSDGKLCRSCSLLHILVYATRLKRQKAKCRLCKTPFAPLHKTDYSLCGTCDPKADFRREFITCVICRKDAKPPYPGVAVCLPCLKTPDKRSLIVNALKRGRDARIDANKDRPRRPVTRVE